MSSDECQILEKTKARDFRCPCGKAYLSYAALFTHIKLKHGGSAPGPIIKPRNSKTRRGRPPIHIRKKSTVQLSSHSYSENSNNEVENSTGTEMELVCQNYFNSQINEDQVQEQVSAYKWMEGWLGGLEGNFQQKSNHPVIKQCYQQFFFSFKKNLQKKIYAEIVMLFALFSQFLADEFNDKQILQGAYMQTISQKINEFILDGYQWLSERAGLSAAWAFQQDNIIRIFDIFFRWASKKEYSNYQVLLKKS